MFLPKHLHLLCLLQCSLLSKPVISADADNIFDLHETANAACASKSTTCGQQSNDKSLCCGFCDCGPNCKAHGSCCLKEYSSLADARDSVEKSR